MKLPGVDVNTQVSAAQTVGCWASTLHTLSIAQVSGVSTVDVYQLIGANNFSLFANALLRFTGLPAGTHRIGVALGAASRLIKKTLVAMSPSPRDLVSIPPLV